MKTGILRPPREAKMEVLVRQIPIAREAMPAPRAQIPAKSFLTPGEPNIRCNRTESPEQYAGCAVTFAFLAEGAANAVFQLRPSSEKAGLNVLFRDENGSPIPHARLLNKVLRVSKGIPKTLPYSEIISGYENVIHPLFRTKLPSPPPAQNQAQPPSSRNTQEIASFEDYLMDDEGVRLNQEIITHLHAQMHGDQCASGPCATVPNMELYGILLPDMSSIPNQALTIEIKPKWLAQSPTAPRDAFQCRTCAMQRLRNKQGKRKRDPYICPLQLVAGNTPAIEKYVRHRVAQEMSGTNKAAADFDMEPVVQRVTAYLATGPGHTLLEFLRTLQSKHDDVGVTMRPATPPRLATSVPTSNMADYDHRLRLAMTLRDCSFFIRISFADPDMPIEAKLCDLDFKSADKIEVWWDKEKRLINGGWYTSVEPGTTCAVTEAWRTNCPWYV
ncbi:unnamed protein product [Periconia digitata]|uniref:Inositol-pentakisphosphate 2-kinase n=1 Tax=Periconia digitata TaxID=1303443 RepID=A0A9W4URH8_9PLEO|nr:unnamed protein product [Periconia digitata]